MSSEIVGLSDFRITLNKRLFFREPNGLERVQDTYVFKTKNFDFLSNQVFINNNKFTSVEDVLEPAPGPNDPSFARMRIERIEYNDTPGGLTLALITYVGITADDYLPPPIVSTTPITDNQWIFNKYIINVQYVTDIGLPGSKKEIDLASSGYSIIPKAINGLLLPIGPVGGSPLIVSTQAPPPQASFNTSWSSCPKFREQCNEDPNTQDQALTTIYGVFSYLGMVASSVQYQRYGEFAVVNVQYRDAAIYQIAGNSGGGCGDILYPPCSSYLTVQRPAYTDS